MINTRLHTKTIWGICLAVMLLGIVLLPGVSRYAFAETSTASNVLDDLKKADNFDVGYYPANSKDYSINVIQIAESTSGELLIYTYQPCQRFNVLTATKVNMSLSAKVDSTKLYDLTLISQEGVFCKYVVKGLNVGDSSIRYYNISTIYRQWIPSIDEPAGNDNTVNGVAYKVGQLWSARSSSDTVLYDMTEVEVVKITDQMIGSRRYKDGLYFDSTRKIDAHFMAFNCDHKIDKLLSARVEFDTTSFVAVKGSDTKYEDPVHKSVDLYDYQVVKNDGSGWFGEEKEWHRMTSAKDFAAEIDASAEEKKTLLKYSWILNFYESAFECDAGGKDYLWALSGPVGWAVAIKNMCTTRGELVSNVSLLRLEFETDGEIYNLGVVSNILTGSNKPTNDDAGKFNLFKWLAEKTGAPEWVWITGLILLVLAIFMPILGAIFPAFGQILLTCIKGLASALAWLLKGIVWLLLLPFKAIKALIEKIKARKG